MKSLIYSILRPLRGFSIKVTARRIIATTFKYAFTGFLIALFITIFDILLEAGLRPGSWRLNTFTDTLRFLAEDCAVNFLLIIIISTLVLLVLLLWKAFKSRSQRQTPVPWPYTFGTAAALLTVFILAVQLKTTILPDFNNLKTKVVLILVACSLPFLLFFYGFTGRLITKKYTRKYFKAITFIVAVLGGITVIAGFILQTNPQKHVESTAVPPGTPNVLIIVIDALRRDFVSYYDDEYAETPNIDDLAAKSVVYTDAYTNAPWTIPSIYTMFTSRYPIVHGAPDRRQGNDKLPLLSEILKNDGYETEAYLANSVMDSRTGLTRGFDRYITYTDYPLLSGFKRSTLYLCIKYYRARRYWTGNADTTRWLTDILCRRLETRRKRPFFIWAHYLDPHGPLTPPIEYVNCEPSLRDKANLLIENQKHGKLRIRKNQKKEVIALYAAEAEYVDDSLAPVFETMKREGLLANTLIIITADHGEELFERTRYGHAKTHNPEVMRIPLIIYVPNSPHQVYAYPVALIDIMPTVLDYVGLDAPDTASGRNILDLVGTEPSGFDEKCVFFSGAGFKEAWFVSVCSPPYMLTRRSSKGDYKYTFSDMRIKTGDLVIQEPPSELFTLYKTTLDDWAEATETEATDLGETQEFLLDRSRKEELKAMGYF
jgi:arylsulfatase A-like enzyme